MIHSRLLLPAACSTLILLIAACAPLSSITIGTSGHPTVKHHQHGPPPHAPAHGYRHKHHHQGQDLELAFDSDLGVYVVIGMPNRYYWNGYYLRIDGDQWYASVDLNKHWEKRSDDSLPHGMKHHKRHHKSKHGKHGKSEKHHPAKGHW